MRFHLKRIFKYAVLAAIAVVLVVWYHHLSKSLQMLKNSDDCLIGKGRVTTIEAHEHKSLQDNDHKISENGFVASLQNVVKGNTTDRKVKSIPANKTICTFPHNNIHDGMPWPICKRKLKWIKEFWHTEECIVNKNVTGDTCSQYKYMSTVEKHCPLISPIPTKPSVQEERAMPVLSLKKLYMKFGNSQNFTFIRGRIKSMEGSWIDAAKELTKTKFFIKRRKLKIHVHLGLMEMGIGLKADKGGPLGELVQWSDVIASLYVMGHEVKITEKSAELKQVYGTYLAKIKDKCIKIFAQPFDLIYTDIRGMLEMKKIIPSEKMDQLKCRLRIVDSFGTEAMYNNNHYGTRKGFRMTEWSGHNLKLQQFNTLYPHTPDNTLLGFVVNVNPQKVSTSVKRTIALVYGKRGKFWDQKKDYLDTIHKYFPDIHSTVEDGHEFIPDYVKNHGLLPIDELNELYQKTKLFIGLGFPFEGPAPLEAIANGAIFLNPSSLTDMKEFYQTKPTTRKISSQNPYAEKFIGEPYVFTIDTKNITLLKETLAKISAANSPQPYLPRELTNVGMLARLSLLTENQNFCDQKFFRNNNELSSFLWWPPLSSLIPTVTEHKQDCSTACSKKGLICEPSFFQVLNRKEAFQTLSLHCELLTVPEQRKTEVDFPAFDPVTSTCYLQPDKLLFGCSGRYTKYIRLCPCREYIHGQTALCKQCMLT